MNYYVNNLKLNEIETNTKNANTKQDDASATLCWKRSKVCFYGCEANQYSDLTEGAQEYDSTLALELIYF